MRLMRIEGGESIIIELRPNKTAINLYPNSRNPPYRTNRIRPQA